MPKNELVFQTLNGDTQNSKIFLLYKDTNGMNTTQKAIASYNFVNKDCKILANQIELHLRNTLREWNCAPSSARKEDINKALMKLRDIYNHAIQIEDRYENMTEEKVIGYDDNNHITAIEEKNGVLSASIEVRVVGL